MDCGGIVDNPGGAITMMHMAQEGFLKHYDCIWIIKPPRNYFHLKTHLYLKITQFSEFGTLRPKNQERHFFHFKNFNRWKYRTGCASGYHL